MRVKPGLVLGLVWCIVFGLISSASAQEGGGWQISQDHATPTFPDEILFSARFSQSENIDQIYLLLRTNSRSCQTNTARQAIEFEPGEVLDVSWKWDLMEAAALPPGAKLYWNWEVVEANGEKRQTAEQSLTIEDPNYHWQIIQTEKFALYWAEGDAEFGRELSRLASASLERLKARLGTEPLTALRIMVYPSAGEVKNATLHTPDWIGGIAFPAYGSILMGIPPGADEWAEEVIPHELTHLVVDQRIDNCVGYRLPTWLNEGIAVYLEGDAAAVELAALRLALEEERLDPLISLTEGFPAQSERANLAYSASRQAVAFLLETFGAEKLDQLFDRVRQGQTVDAALLEIYGYDTPGLDLAWRADFGYGAAPTYAPVTPTPKAKRTSAPTVALWTAAPYAASQTPTPSATPVTALTSTLTPSAQATRVQSGSGEPRGNPKAGWLLTGSAISLMVCCGGAVLLAAGIGLFLWRRSGKGMRPSE